MPTQGGYSPGLQSQMTSALQQQGVYPDDSSQGAELLRRLNEVQRTRQAAQEQPADEKPPFNVFTSALPTSVRLGFKSLNDALAGR